MINVGRRLLDESKEMHCEPEAVLGRVAQTGDRDMNLC